MIANPMADTDSLLNRWRKAGVLDAEAEDRIRAFEKQQAAGASHGLDLARMGWQGTVALVLGAILLACGVVLFVSAHWDSLGPAARYSVAVLLVAAFHLAGGLVREKHLALSTALHGIGTAATGAAIALVGQIFNLQEQWPVAILLWALAAAAGWLLLRDEVQQTLTLLLVPAWILSELEFQMVGATGENVFLGRILLVWAVLYLTFFRNSSRRIVQGILFAAGAVAALTGTVYMLGGWVSWSSTQSFVPFSVAVWAWAALAAVPLAVAAFHGHKGLVPIACAIAYAWALPWCQSSRAAFLVAHVQGRILSEPNLAAHALVTLFAVFLCYWGMRLTSRALVNFAIAAFAISVAWFYFSDIYTRVGRSIGLIGLGVLFLLGGWALERARRRLIAGMNATAQVEEGQ